MVGALRFAYPTILLFRISLARRPCESRDPYAVPYRFSRGGRGLLSNERRWLWVPAFAGTTWEDSIVKQQTRLRAPRREAPELCIYLSPPLRAWGMPGARCTRSLVCSVLVAHEYSPQVHRDHPAFPHAMVLTACFVLSPVTGLVCHRHQRILAVSVRSDRHASANLTPASGRQDHTTSPSAAIVSRQRAPCRSRIHRIRPATFSRAKRCRVHRIPCPTSVTIAIRPSCGTGWRNQ